MQILLNMQSVPLLLKQHLKSISMHLINTEEHKTGRRCTSPCYIVSNPLLKDEEAVGTFEDGVFYIHLSELQADMLDRTVPQVFSLFLKQPKDIGSGMFVTALEYTRTRKRSSFPILSITYFSAHPYHCFYDDDATCCSSFAKCQCECKILCDNHIEEIPCPSCHYISFDPEPEQKKQKQTDFRNASRVQIQ